MVVIEPSVVFSSLDSFFGGFGKGVGQLPSGRLFTPTESRIIKLILNVFFRSMKEAWSPVLPVEFDVISSEINPQFAQIADENDLVVVSRFDSEGGQDANGFLDMVYPYSALKPLRDVFRNRVQTSDATEDSDCVWANELAVAVKDSELLAHVSMGEVVLSLQEFENMKEGDVLPFKKPDFARLIVNEVPVFDGQVGTIGKQVAIRLETPVRLQQVPRQ
jgi:flagellar motor switch protein FliM